MLFNQAKATALSAAYIEAVRNLELAKINVQKETPLFRVIDEPDLPLAPQKKSATRYLVLVGLAATAFITVILLLFRLILLLRKEPAVKDSSPAL
jgi:uncharacterized protein involved in exopolysaccharide biosynthesis